MNRRTSALYFMGTMMMVLFSCHAHRMIPVDDKAGTFIGIFHEKFKKVIENSDGKIKVQIDLGHRDGFYLAGDEPYLHVTTNKPAHLRLLYVTGDGSLLQKFPPLDITDQRGSAPFVNDFIAAKTRYRIPQASDPYKYVVTVPDQQERAQELVIAIASSVPFTSIDSLIQAKMIRDPRRYTESAIKSNIVNLGILLYPEAGILKWAPYVFDLFTHVFIHKRSGYSFGYDYKIITISR